MEPTSVTSLKGVGEALAATLKKLDIATIEDLVEYVPRRYEDYSQIIRISQIRPGSVSIRVRFQNVKSRYSKRGLHITEAMATDESGSVQVIWFNQPYRAASIKVNEEYFISGEFAKNHRYFAITNPACELVSSFPVNTARLVPVYKLTKGLGLAQLRKIMRTALLSMTPKETLPSWLLQQENLMARADALMQMHFPTSKDQLEKAKFRLGFEEVFQLSLASELNKKEFSSQHSLEIPFNEQLIKSFVSSLPFTLTDDQRRAAWETFQDMAKGRPMNRLIEGDVGSGKTMVAALAALGAMQAGFQVGFMAPTELLANQHASTLHSVLKDVGYQEKLLLLTGSMSAAQKKAAQQSIAEGKAKLIVGTHALFQEAVTFQKLGLIIVDEQHRFGVDQRKQLQAKATLMPHVLNLTATPIPRSLALTLYGEMDISIIASMPTGRKPVLTRVEIPERRQQMYAQISERLRQGEQAFVVCPQIESTDIRHLSVKDLYKEIQTGWLKEFRVGMLHGKLKAEDKDAMMQQFINKELDVLVSTTVIEVGVDVPNATVMVIEGADKFGLAQLHQLRGRVGRGQIESICYLVLSTNEEPQTRIKVLEHERNGFRLAEYDLELRGPGAIYGTMQHGELDLRVAKLTDVHLIKQARKAAIDFVSRNEEMIQYPQLNERVVRLRTIDNLN